MDPHIGQLPVGLIAQLVLHCTQITEVRVQVTEIRVQVQFRPESFRHFLSLPLSRTHNYKGLGISS